MCLYCDICFYLYSRKKEKIEQGNQNRDSQINDEDAKDLYERIVGRMIDFSRRSIVPVSVPLFFSCLFIYFLYLQSNIQKYTTRSRCPATIYKRKKRKKRRNGSGLCAAVI